MKIDPAQLEATIREVLAAMLPGNDNQTEAPAKQQEAPGDGVFADMDSAVEAAHLAQREYLSHSMADRRRYVAAIRVRRCWPPRPSTTCRNRPWRSPGWAMSATST